MKLTREEIEQRLEEKYLGAVVSITLPRFSAEQGLKTPPDFGIMKISGKILRLAVELIDGEPIVVFKIRSLQYKADVNYFIENITIHGNTHTGGAGSGRLPEGD